MFLVVIGIDIRVAMSFSKALVPDTGITAMLLIVYSIHIAIATGIAPIQLDTGRTSSPMARGQVREEDMTLEQYTTFFE